MVLFLYVLKYTVPDIAKISTSRNRSAMAKFPLWAHAESMVSHEGKYKFKYQFFILNFQTCLNLKGEIRAFSLKHFWKSEYKIRENCDSKSWTPYYTQKMVTSPIQDVCPHEKAWKFKWFLIDKLFVVKDICESWFYSRIEQVKCKEQCYIEIRV